MKAFKEIVRVRRAAVWQLLPEAMLGVALFGVIRSLMTAGMENQYFSLRFHLLPYLAYLAPSPAWKVAGVSVLLAVSASFLLRLFFWGGLFANLTARGRSVSFWDECARHFPRFLLLFVILFLPTVVAAGLILALLQSVLQTDHTVWMVVWFLVQQAMLGLVLLVISYFHTLSRYRTVQENRVRLALRLSGRSFWAFFGYHFLGLFLLVLFVLPAALFVMNGRWYSSWIALGLWALGITSQLFCRLAAVAAIAPESNSDHHRTLEDRAI